MNESASYSWHDACLGSLVHGEEPVTLPYLDTQHAGQNSDPYTTIIAVHGSGYNSKIWKSWIPLLGDNIRLLAYNRRGYEGSSAMYEPHPSPSGKPGSVEASWRYMLDLLAFVKYAAEDLKVPCKDDRVSSGGIVLLGWSKGCAPMVALLYVLSSLPTISTPVTLPCSLAPFLSVLDSHLRTIILFEPGNTVGLHGAKHYVSELAGVLYDERASAFARWMRGTVPADKAHLLDDAADQDAVLHDMGCILSPAGNAPVVEHAFEKNPLPTCVGVVYCTETVPHCLESGKWLQAKVSGQPNASVRIIQGGNHFAMATNPDVWASTIMDVITMLSNV